MKFLKLMESWNLMFSEAPEEIILTGWYIWNDKEDDDLKLTGDYE
jgi:hypothetical protein